MLNNYNEMSKRLWDALGTGAGHATPTAAIADDIGLSLESVKELVKAMRRDTDSVYPVCANDNGLFIPSCAAEFEDYHEKRLREIRSQYIGGCKMFADPRIKQLSIYDIDDKRVN